MTHRRHLFVLGAIVVLLTIGAGHGLVSAENSDLSYDEIVKFSMTATPPPPGTFDADYAAMMQSNSSAAAAPAAPTPPPKRGLFGGFNPGNMAQAIAGGNSMGSTMQNGAGDTASGAGDAAASNQMGGMMPGMPGMPGMGGGFANFARGTLMRHAFYGKWERVDDLLNQTATIDKCDLHQRIELDLAKHTYKVVDTTPHADPSGSGTTCDGPATTDPAASSGTPSGTGTLNLSSTTSALPAAQFGRDSIPGTKTRLTMSIQNATGSCKNSSFSMTESQYFSAYGKAHPFCLLPTSYRHPSTPQEMAQGRSGCKLTEFHAGMAGAAGLGQSNHLALYELMQMDSPNGGNHSMGFVTERGNIRTLGSGDAGLFGIPAGYTQIK